uniref:Membrane-spanning 4-domains subfamily A member 4A-like n=1 Tax=Astyanax mexicanus TaxID=7994 RepID=A0A8B9L5A2_ASTMX
MATSVQPAENTIHGFTIVTHVVPAGTGHYGQSTEAGASTTGQFGKFLKGDPKALGVVQIMIGIITFMLGIVSAVFFYTASKVIGVMFWGAVLVGSCFGLWYGIAGIQLVLAVLEFIISICTSAFACKATCCNDPVRRAHTGSSSNTPVHTSSSDPLRNICTHAHTHPPTRARAHTHTRTHTHSLLHCSSSLIYLKYSN